MPALLVVRTLHVARTLSVDGTQMYLEETVDCVAVNVADLHAVALV